MSESEVVESDAGNGNKRKVEDMVDLGDEAGDDEHDAQRMKIENGDNKDDIPEDTPVVQDAEEEGRRHSCVKRSLA